MDRGVRLVPEAWSSKIHRRGAEEVRLGGRNSTSQRPLRPRTSMRQVGLIGFRSGLASASI